MDHLSARLGHPDRHAGLKGYGTRPMLPPARKSVEPMAARIDPVHASNRRQALHRFAARSDWSDQEVLRRVCQWVVPRRGPAGPVGGSPMTPGSRRRASTRLECPDNPAGCRAGRTTARSQWACPWRASRAVSGGPAALSSRGLADDPARNQQAGVAAPPLW